MSREWVSLRVSHEIVAYARKVAAENDETTSAVLRRLLSLGVTAHRGKPIETASTTPPAVVKPTAPKTVVPKPAITACRGCATCTGYVADPRRMLTCECGHAMGMHRPS